MDIFPKMLIAFQLTFFLAVAVALVYLLIRRINIRDREDFEKRDN